MEVKNITCLLTR